MLTEEWAKATKSGAAGHCLKARWQTASKSNSNGNGGCVKARWADGMVEIQDSKAGEDGPVQRYTPAEWVAFLDGARQGEFDLPPGVTP